PPSPPRRPSDPGGRAGAVGPGGAGLPGGDGHALATTVGLGGPLLGQPAGGLGVATEDRAVGLEGAVAAQRRPSGPEVLALAGPLDRLPDGPERAAGPPGGAVGPVRGDGQRLPQVPQLPRAGP